MQTSELVELKKSIHEESWKPAYKFLPELIQKFNLKVGAEIGVAFGGHSEAMLSNTNLELLYGIDSYQHSDSYDDPMNLPQADFDILCETTKNRLAVFGDRFRLIRSDSQQAISQIEGLLDFVYIDADNSYQGVWQDLCTWYSKIRVGGLISGHDYEHIALPGVKQAIDEFFRRLDWQVNLEGEGVWWVEKQPVNISFFIPAYNCEETLEESVDSILNGNFEQGDELIIVNDCSTDNTEGILEGLKIKYPLINIFRHETNKGGGAARNTAVQNASHPLLFCLDSDNILVPGSIQKLKEFLLDSGADVAAFQEIHYFVGGKENIINKWIYQDQITLADFFSRHDVPGASGNYLFTKESWVRAGGYSESSGALDTHTFGFRQLATGSKMLTLPNTYYCHRQSIESYYVRFSRNNNLSLPWEDIIAPFAHLIADADWQYMCGDGKYTWFSELEKRPICIRNIGENLPYEETLIRQLCFDTKSLNLQGEPPSTNEAWESCRKRLIELILTENPRNFLNWDVINATMFYDTNIIEVELKYLQLLPDWLQWKEAIKESPVGNPIPYFAYPESSGNLIHHAYHLAQLMRWTGCALTETTQIVEFGGGYGSMCRLAHQLGFKGQYVIFDIPEFSNLQEYFLKSIGLSTVVVKNQVTEIDRHISLQWDINKLSQQLSNATSNMAFVATWSISEAPVSVREQVFNLVADAKFYLIAYQEEFEGVNNLEYFAQFAQNKPNYQWYGWAIEHLPGNHYLIGVQTPLEAAKNPVVTLSTLGVENIARFGNKIFMYAFLRMYAREHNLRVETPAWIGQYLFGHNEQPISQPLPQVREPALRYKLSEWAILNAPEPLKNVDFHGNFQFHTQAHARHKEYFQSLFKPVPEVEAKVREALDHLRSKGKTVVGLHLRRGDYRSIHIHTLMPYLTIAPSEWYREWLDGFWETLDEPVLFIASDEIENVVGDFADYNPITVKDLGVEMPEAPFYPDFYILSQCDVLAISNSTFSFTAAMLNERCKFFFRPNLVKQKLIAFDPWNSEPLLRDHPNELLATGSQETIKLLNIQEVSSISPEDPELLFGFHIDYPRLGTHANPSNLFLIAGWVIGKKSPAVKVELIRDGEVIRDILVNENRQDVAAVFPGVPLAENSGYMTEWEITGTLAKCEISIQAVLANETRVKFGVIRWQETIYHTPLNNKRARCELSVGAIMKDEAPYLIEWLEFHKIVGVERFYLYNNNSTDNTVDILQPYLQSGEVILHDWPFTPGQISAYEHCLNTYKNESEWIAFIDMDEFLFPTEKDDIKEVLEEFYDFPGVAVNWLVFGSSGHKTRPEGLQVEKFSNRSEENFGANKMVKTIVRPEFATCSGNPHHFLYFNDEVVVTENKEPIVGPWSTANSVQKLRINHYFTRSLQESQEKMLRGRSDTPSPRQWRFEEHDRNEVEDLTIQRFVPKLRQAVDAVISQSRIAQILTEQWRLKTKLYQMQMELEASETKQHQNPGDFEQLTTKLQQVQEELQPIKEELELWQVQCHKTQEELAQTKSQLIEAHTQLQEMESVAAPLNQLAELYLAQGKLEEAIAVSEQVLKIQPKFAPAYKTLGNVLQAQGKLEEAKLWYNKALEIQPDFSPA